MSLVSENLLKWTIHMKYDNILESNPFRATINSILLSMQVLDQYCVWN